MRFTYSLAYKGISYSLDISIDDDGDFRIVILDQAINSITLTPDRAVVHFGFSNPGRVKVYEGREYDELLDKLERIIRSSIRMRMLKVKG